MATRLDQQIEQIWKIVEKCVNLSNMRWNGSACALPLDDEHTKPYRFPVEFLETQNVEHT
jgi:hypothetical protein